MAPMCSEETRWTSARHHLFLLGVACFLFVAYGHFPSLFAFLLDSSPVIACTALLLGIFLSYGEPNITENIGDDNISHTISSTKIEIVGNVNGAKNVESFKTDAHVGSTRETKRMTVRTSVSKAVGKNEVNQTDVTSVSSSSSVQGGNKSMRSLAEGKGHTTGKLADGSLKAAGASAEKDITVLDADASSYSESDGEERSNTSMANTRSMLDELDPLLDLDIPQADLVSKDNPDDASVEFSENHVSDDDSMEEEAETQDDEDDEEPQEEKDDVHKVAVTWTADDQRNVLELRHSEIERNRWLENVIARRIARKVMEKNLIDLDDMDETSQSHGHLSSFSAPKRNPFHLPEDSDEIPGSAPSVLLPRQNPFDLSFEQVDDQENPSHKAFDPVPQRDVLFRRHESFTVGASFYGDFEQGKRASRFKPCFGADKNELEETFYADLHGKLSEASDSKDTISSGTDQEHHKDLHRVSESAGDGSQSSEDSDSSDDIETVDAEQAESQMNINNDHTTHSSKVTKPKLTHRATKKYATVQDDTSQESGAERESSSSSPSEAEKSTSKMSTNEQDSGIVKVEGDHVVDPVYDSSPPNSTLDEGALHIAEKGGLICTERNVPSSRGAEKKTVRHGNRFHWFASSSLASVDENESGSREISVIKELDVLGDELSKVHKDFAGPVLRILSAPAIRKRMLGSRYSSLEINAGEDNDS